MKHFLIIFLLALSLSSGCAVLYNKSTKAAFAPLVDSENFVQGQLLSNHVFLFLCDLELDSSPLAGSALERSMALILDYREGAPKTIFEARINRLLLSPFFSGLSPPSFA